MLAEVHIGNSPHGVDIERLLICVRRSGGQRIVNCRVVDTVSVRPPSRRVSGVEVVGDRHEAPGSDFRCELAIHRPQDAVRVQFVACERNHLFRCVNPFVRAAGNECLNATRVWFKCGFQLALNSSDIWLSCIAEEAGTVVCEVEAICRHDQNLSIDPKIAWAMTMTTKPPIAAPTALGSAMSTV